MFRYDIRFRLWHAAFCSMRETVAFLDLWRPRDPWLRVVAYGSQPVDEDDDGLTTDERECVNEPPGPHRDALVARIDAEREVAA